VRILSGLSEQGTERPIRVSVSLEIPDGVWLTGVAEILTAHMEETRIAGLGIARISRLDGVSTWLPEGDDVYFKTVIDGYTLEAVRKPEPADYRHFRLPVWIQEPEIPSCCEHPMMFVGQLDDNLLCTQWPPDAALWWHDASSFYVFTCPQCLGVKAVGQQF
jgi:hypothetical protein